MAVSREPLASVHALNAAFQRLREASRQTGASGMGQLNGHAGFLTFSQQKPVFRQARINGMGLMKPPYGPLFERLLRLLLR